MESLSATFFLHMKFNKNEYLCYPTDTTTVMGIDIPITKKELTMSLYEEYERIRDERGWNNKTVARRAGTTEATISRWKTGARSPELRTLEKIAQALGVKLTMQDTD